jgi:hypothetical protein
MVMSEDIVDVKKEIAREKGIEGVFAKRYPELYERLKQIAEQTNQSVIDLIASYTNWALELREFSGVLTKEDLKNITADSLYSAMKLLLFLEERYLRIAGYISWNNLIALLDVFNRMYMAYSGSQSQTPPAPILPLPSPQQEADKTGKLFDVILKTLEYFSMGREDVRKALAKEVAKELFKMAGGEQTEKTGSVSNT